DQQEFDDGLVLVKQGFGNFSDAIPEIQNALTKFEKINREETLDAAASQGVESDVEEQLNLIQGTVNLINAALDILNVLISPSELPPPSPGFTVEEPLIHLLRGALSLTGASSSVGDNSDFSGTGPTFQSIINHLTVVVDTFDDDAFNTFENDTDVLEVEELVDMKDQLQGMFNFIQDSGNIAISMGAFGLVASPTLISMNETLQVFKEKEFTDITPTEYKDRIDDFDLPGGIIENATRMMNDGEAVDNQVLAMEVRSNNDEYGLLSTAAEDFVSVFKDFDMATNGKNFFHLSHAFSNILKTGRDMTVVDSEVAKIQLESAFLSTVDYINNASAIDDSILRIEASLTIINEKLANATIFVTYASGNFSEIGQTMPQMAQTSDALTGPTGIVSNIGATQTAITNMTTTTSTLPANNTDFINKLSIIEEQLGLVSVELDNVTDNLTKVEIAS
ncbi:MAG: hypothetical protein ACW99Q_11680, partial [Candidatus Kariarchaeaceae archaeon]